jgi:hypothetical protein
VARAAAKTIKVLRHYYQTTEPISQCNTSDPSKLPWLRSQGSFFWPVSMAFKRYLFAHNPMGIVEVSDLRLNRYGSIRSFVCKVVDSAIKIPYNVENR